MNFSWGLLLLLCRVEQTNAWVHKVQQAWKEFSEKMRLLEEVNASDDDVLQQMTLALEKTPEEFQSVIISKASIAEVSMLS